MTSEGYRLHVALYPSLKALDIAGMGELKVKMLRGNFSKNVGVVEVKPHSRFVLSTFIKQVKTALIYWSASKDKDARSLPTIHDIVLDLEKEGIPDCLLNELSIIRETVEFNNYTLQNEVKPREWRFSTMTFRPLMWSRLKATDFPGKKIYEKWLATKRKLKDKLGREVFKRWKDAILMNDPQLNRDLENYEIRALWIGYPVLILKESRGTFSLMDIGEWEPKGA